MTANPDLSVRVSLGRRFRQRILLAFLLLMVIAYARQLLTSPIIGQDFRVFFAAAVLLSQGADPYDWPSLARTEDALYNAPSHLTPDHPAYSYFLVYPEGPWLAFGLMPLSGWPWPLAYVAFAGLMGLLMAVAAWLIFAQFSWPRRLRWLALVCILLCPIAFINLFIGQVSPLLFGVFSLAWMLTARGRARWGGLLLALAWIKPNIGLVLPAVVALLEPRHARQVLGGFVAGSAVLFLIAGAKMGWALFEWPMEIPRFWQAFQGPQPDVASIHSFYYPALSGWAKPALLALVLAAISAYGVWALRQAMDPTTRGLSLLLIWLFGLPFVQSYDMILLLPLVAALLGAGLKGWEDRITELAIWAFMVFPLCYFLGLRVGFFNGFTAIPVALLALAWHRCALQQRRLTALRVAA